MASKRKPARSRPAGRTNASVLPPTCPTDEEVEKSTDFFKWAYEAQPPWDIGRPQPAVVELDDLGEITGSVLDVGCGTGENSLFLAKRGHHVTGVDIIPKAIELAEKKKTERGVKNAEFRAMSAFKLDTLGKKFDTVIDCGLFHTFDDDERDCFIADLKLAMHVGSMYQMLCFSDKAADIPGPRHLSKREIESLFNDGLKVRSIRSAFFETNHSPSKVPAWLASVEKV